MLILHNSHHITQVKKWNNESGDYHIKVNKTFINQLINANKCAWSLVANLWRGSIKKSNYYKSRRRYLITTEVSVIKGLSRETVILPDKKLYYFTSTYKINHGKPLFSPHIKNLVHEHIEDKNGNFIINICPPGLRIIVFDANKNPLAEVRFYPIGDQAITSIILTQEEGKSKNPAKIIESKINQLAF